MDKNLLARLASPVATRFAAQLGHPRGWFGRVVMTRLLNRANAEIITATLDALALAPGSRLLDVGFGGGVSLKLARARGVTKLYGLDPSESAVAAIRESSRAWIDGASLDVARGSVEAMPYADASFDAIVSTNTIYFWPDLPKALAELRRVLVPGGTLALGFAGDDRLRGLGEITRHGFILRTPEDVEQAARSVGLEAVRVIALHGKATEGEFVLVGRRG